MERSHTSTPGNTQYVTKQVTSSPDTMSNDMDQTRQYLPGHPTFSIKLFPLPTSKQRDQALHEIERLKMLSHPFILPILDAGLHQQSLYVVTEQSAYSSLYEQLQQQFLDHFTIDDILIALSQIGQALSYAHQQDILHLNLTLKSIFFNSEGNVLISDFSIMTMFTIIPLEQTRDINALLYTAPEVFQSIASPQSDQYSLGCIAYELLTGHTPFTAYEIATIYQKHVSEQPLPLRHYHPHFSAHIEEAILTSLAKDPQKRHANIETFIGALYASSSAPSQLSSTSKIVSALLDTLPDHNVPPINLVPAGSSEGQLTNANHTQQSFRKRHWLRWSIAAITCTTLLTSSMGALLFAFSLPPTQPKSAVQTSTIPFTSGFPTTNPSTRSSTASPTGTAILSPHITGTANTSPTTTSTSHTTLPQAVLPPQTRSQQMVAQQVVQPITPAILGLSTTSIDGGLLDHTCTLHTPTNNQETCPITLRNTGGLTNWSSTQDRFDTITGILAAITPAAGTLSSGQPVQITIVINISKLPGTCTQTEKDNPAHITFSAPSSSSVTMKWFC